MKARKVKALLSLFGIIGLTLIINSYMERNEKEIAFPGNLYGIPTYQDSRLSFPMSSMNGDPYEKVLQFYKDKLTMDFKVLKYGHKKRKHMTLTIYQFEIEKGELENCISKGIEIIPLNSRSQGVYKARTKIKIILPRREVLEFNKKKEEKIDH